MEYTEEKNVGEIIVPRLNNTVTMAIFNWIDKFMTDVRHDTIKLSDLPDSPAYLLTSVWTPITSLLTTTTAGLLTKPVSLICRYIHGALICMQMLEIIIS